MNAPTKKWSMNEKWFGARITGPVADLLRPDCRARGRTSSRSDVDDPAGLVDPVGVARAGALVEAREVRLRARVLVDLRADRREVGRRRRHARSVVIIVPPPAVAS
jgi:hypothetical protein